MATLYKLPKNKLLKISIADCLHAVSVITEIPESIISGALLREFEDKSVYRAQLAFLGCVWIYGSTYKEIMEFGVGNSSKVIHMRLEKVQYMIRANRGKYYDAEFASLFTECKKACRAFSNSKKNLPGKFGKI